MASLSTNDLSERGLMAALEQALRHALAWSAGSSDSSRFDGLSGCAITAEQNRLLVDSIAPALGRATSRLLEGTAAGAPRPALCRPAAAAMPATGRR